MSHQVSAIAAPTTSSLGSLEKAAHVAAVWSILAIGLHLWPFEGRHSLETTAPINLGIMLWVLAGILMLASSRARWLAGHLPDRSVWAFLAVSTASLGFSPHIGQSTASLAKLALMYVGAYTLFGLACTGEGWPRRLCNLAMVAASIAVIAAIAWALAGRRGIGFFNNGYKYGTATAILFTLGCVHLASRQSLWAWMALPLAMLAAVAQPSLGGLCATIAGLTTGMLLLKSRPARLRLAACLLMTAAVMAACWQTSILSRLRNDVRLGEPGGQDLRQRYIEWQAELNLLEKRPIAGTGLGCVNEYRSMFYGRLPKLNTLDAFDRSGWLLTAAETGVLGLAAFVWMIIAAGRSAWRAARLTGEQADVAAAAFAALVAACVANTFSSVNYNGVLNAFVLVLALAHYSAAMAQPRREGQQSIPAVALLGASMKPTGGSE